MSATAGRLVLADDDDLFRAMLAGNLEEAGFTVLGFADGGATLAALLSDGPPPDLLILDWRMPGLSGIELLRRLRQAGKTTPALFLTSLSENLYEEAALGTGAVDFVDKTRSFGVLLRRIELILSGRRAPAAGPAPFRLGRLEIDPARHRVLWRGAEVRLTPGELRVVQALAQADRDVGYREIYDAVRGENFVAGDGPEGLRANVRSFVKRVRQKFQQADPEFAAIETCPGFGYRWVGR